MCQLRQNRFIYFSNFVKSKSRLTHTFDHLEIEAPLISERTQEASGEK